MHTVLRHLHHTGFLQGVIGPSDAQLLESFVARREEAAFAALVKRHGPMVLGVCRRVLRNHHDAEDAFQATFLVLVRKAAAVRPRDMVGNWLYGVAYRTALRARAMNAKRRAKEEMAGSLPRPASGGVEWEELLPLLDQELSRLPDKYRAPVVLCDLEGKTRTAAARQLGWPVGTLSWRLAAARQRLARRLVRHGVTLSGAALATAFSQGSASAAVSAALMASTTQAALLVAAGQAAAAGVVSASVAALAEGVLKMMFLAKLKTASVTVFGVAVLGMTTGGFFYQTRAGAADDQERPAQVKQSSQTVAQQERDRPREANSPTERERALRQQLEEVQRMAESLRAEVQRLRQYGEEGHRRAEEAAAQARRAMEAEHAAKRDAEKVRYAAEVQQALAQRNPGAEQSRRGESPTAEQYKHEMNRLMQEFDNRSRELQQQLRNLAEERRIAITRLKSQLEEQERAEAMRRQQPDVPGRGDMKRPAGGDKLDQILERLERMEQRLDRLERGRR